jgi:hypothetical protein
MILAVALTNIWSTAATVEDVARQELTTAMEPAPTGAVTSVEAPALSADALVALQTASQATRDRATATTTQEARDVAAALKLQVAELNGVPPSTTAIRSSSCSTTDASPISSLHAHATGIHNIWTLVHVTLDVHSTQYSLDVHSTQYSRCRDLVMLTLQRFTLDDHVTVDTAPSATPGWLWMDNVVLSWRHRSLGLACH